MTPSDVKNPRVLLWLSIVGLSPADIAHDAGKDMRMVTVNGHHNLWTIHFTEWIRAQWKAWARNLGYTHHESALLDGHTDKEFDKWLGVPDPVSDERRYREALQAIFEIGRRPFSAHQPPRRALENQIAEMWKIAYLAMNPEDTDQ